MTSAGLVLYDQMVTAIAECERVDEAKDIRDKAAALEAYYKQARNLEAERKAANVRLRAERRAGELLKELARATPQTANPSGLRAEPTSNDATRVPPSPFASTLASTGMSRQTAHRYQALANVPKDVFDAALADPAKPTTNGVLARAQVREAADPVPRVSDSALWLWGRLRDFERDGYLGADRRTLLVGMTDAMRADVLRLAPLVAEFLTSLEDVHEPA